jgi:DNA processing protein
MNPETGRPPSSASLEAWMKLRAIAGVGDHIALVLVREWGTPEAVLRATVAELMHKGCSAKLADAIVRGPDRDACRRIARELHGIERRRIEVRSILDRNYPRRLLTIPDPPPLLYIGGSVTESDELAIAVVGARRATPAGRLVTERLASGLAGAGFTIVSGLARGIDAAAHRGALAARGRTLAVLGCGLGSTYPPEHERLRREIEEHGAVLSELALDVPPHSGHFPRRNRIISGLSFGVVVAEAAIDSGSLITAGLAAEQGREVFAVPGSVHCETSRGTHALIKEGATLVEQVQDVIDVMYCGAVGWIEVGADGAVRAELAVGIRTFWWADDVLRFGTGAGITWGSDPEREWAETELKAARLVGLASGAAVETVTD